MLTQGRRRPQWGKLPMITKFGIISVGVFFLLALLWGTGTVDVSYVRTQLTTLTSSGNEPIPQEHNTTPIIDGVPNDANDRPIPEGIVEASLVDEKKVLETENNEAVAESQEIVTDEDKAVMAHRATNNTDSGPIANGIPIRVMFMGASITLGDPPQGAYRKQLRDWMVGLGNKVNCVGDNQFGLFKDNDVQAYAATPVLPLHQKSLHAVPHYAPNLVIINAGSSDCFQEEHWGSAHGYDYTKSLVDFVFSASPNTTVILSTLITSADPAFERCILSYNAQIRQVVIDVAREGGKILLSEQHWDQGLPGRVTVDDMKSDKMHPTFKGWEMMGEIYKGDIRRVSERGWIVRAVENGVPDDGIAEGTSTGVVKPTSSGSGSGNAKPTETDVPSGARRLRWNDFWN